MKNPIFALIFIHFYLLPFPMQRYNIKINKGKFQ
jgi:hypothetical protein